MNPLMRVLQLGRKYYICSGVFTQSGPKAVNIGRINVRPLSKLRSTCSSSSQELAVDKSKLILKTIEMIRSQIFSVVTLMWVVLKPPV